MAFKLRTTDDGRVPPTEYIPCGAITPKLGMALVQTAGNLAVAAGTSKPAYISLVERTAACTAGERIPVMRVQPDMVFDTVNTASFAAINRGDKVTLHTDGLQVTATTASGVAEVVDFSGTAAGSVVSVRFA